MNARILPLDSDEHRFAQSLLPWHANGTLETAESARLRLHLADCERCRADLAGQARLREALRAAGAPPSAAPAETARGWARLLDELGASDGATPAAAARPAVRPHARPAVRPAPRSPRWTAFGAAPRPATGAGPRPTLPRWWPSGAKGGFAYGFAGALALVLAMLYATGGEPASVADDGSFRALGSAAPADTANALIVFHPDASEAQVRRALRDVKARLVGGPTVTDAYLLQIAAPLAPALGRLRADPAVVRVESLDREGAR